MTDSVFIANSQHFSNMIEVCKHLKNKKQYNLVVFQGQVYSIFQGDFGLTDYSLTDKSVEDVFN